MKVLLIAVLCLVPLTVRSYAYGSTWSARMERLARATEARYGLPHGTCRAFALQESTYDTAATRAESGYFNKGSRYARAITREAEAFLAARGSHIPLAVEREQRSVSYGLFQIMGENYRTLGYGADFIAPTMEEQFEYFGRFVAPLWSKYHSLAAVASCYNSGGPHATGGAYAQRVVRYQKQFAHD